MVSNKKGNKDIKIIFISYNFLNSLLNYLAFSKVKGATMSG